MTKPARWLVSISLLFASSPAMAIRLNVAPDAHDLLHVGAALLLYGHIGSGVLGVVSGLVASLTTKGGSLHRKAGLVFFWAMLMCYLIGAIVAPLLESQQSTNFVAAILALYLLLSGLSAARRRRFIAGKPEVIGAVVAALITLLGVGFMVLASQSPDGSLDGSPPQAYVMFVFAGSLALLGDLRALWHKQLSQTARVLRHLWRMSFSFFIATGSVFFGQAQFFPDGFNGTPLPLIFGFFPLLVLLIYLGKYASTGLRRRLRSLAQGAT